MKRADYWKVIKDRNVQCELCPRMCVIKEGKYGNCSARKNVEGVLMSMVYGKVCAAEIDPIEKKPLFHFLPGSRTFSIATAGCNFHCLNCQNWAMSQTNAEDYTGDKMSPSDVINRAVAGGCMSISYTYTEPTVFYEFMLETAKLAKDRGIRNVMVTNGYINEKPLLELCRYIDAVNVDVKGDDKFYEEVCGAKKKFVLESLKILKKKGVWVEITYLIIPGYNDLADDIKEVCQWVEKNIGRDTPIHFSRFFPMYKMEYMDATPMETLEMARKVAEDYLDYVYIGNIFIDGGEDTMCPKCRKTLIKRFGYEIVEDNIKEGKCCFCNHKTAGVFQ